MFPCILKEIEIEGTRKKKTKNKKKETNAFGSVPRLQEKVQVNTEINQFGIQSSVRRDQGPRRPEKNSNRSEWIKNICLAPYSGKTCWWWFFYHANQWLYGKLKPENIVSFQQKPLVTHLYDHFFLFYMIKYMYVSLMYQSVVDCRVHLVLKSTIPFKLVSQNRGYGKICHVAFNFSCRLIFLYLCSKCWKIMYTGL